MIQISKTKLKGVLKITSKPFVDHRGKYIEIYNRDFLKKKKIKLKFIQDDISVSKKNVLRGIHGDQKTWKLITCLHGEFDLLVVNNNKSSKEYKKYCFFKLSDKNNIQILIPPKFGNAHYVKSKFTIFHYKQTTNYDRKNQFTIKWNDTNYKFKWKLLRKPILSKRDS